MDAGLEGIERGCARSDAAGLAPETRARPHTKDTPQTASIRAPRRAPMFGDAPSHRAYAAGSLFTRGLPEVLREAVHRAGRPTRGPDAPLGMPVARRGCVRRAGVGRSEVCLRRSANQVGGESGSFRFAWERARSRVPERPRHPRAEHTPAGRQLAHDAAPKLRPPAAPTCA
jgi:hypothetical protein